MPEPSKGLPSSWKTFLRRHRGWLLVALSLLLVIVVRVRLRDLPLERDEGEYAYAGQLLLHGVPPYREVYNMKLPGTYAAYAAIMAVFGQTPSGIRLGLTLVNVACILLVFRIGRRLLDESAGVAAAIAFALLSLSPLVLGLAAHATHFVTLAALLGLWLLLRSLASTPAEPHPLFRHTRWMLGLSGFSFGLAFLMKQHGLFFGLFGGLYLLRVRLGEWRTVVATTREENRANSTGSLAGRAALTRLAADLACFGLGWMLPYAFTCLLLAVAGAFQPFLFWTVTYAARYASAISLLNGPDMLRSALRVVIGPNLLLWILPWLGALVMWWDTRLDPAGSRLRTTVATSRVPYARFFLVLFLFCSFGSASVGLYFREHYFITVLPALALLTGVAVSRALFLLQHDKTIELFLAVPILGLFAFGIGAALVGHGPLWLALPRDQALPSVFGSTLFAETANAAEYLKAHSGPSDRVAVLGSEPEIYFLSHRRSASGFIYMYPLMELQPYALKMQEQMIREIEQARPEYFVYVDDDFSWLRRSSSQSRIFDWWNDYWPKNLDLVQTLDITEGQFRGTDMDQPVKEPVRIKHLLIFRRRP